MPVIRISNEAYQTLLTLQAKDGNTMSVFFDRFVADAHLEYQARLKAKVEEEAKVAVERQLEAVHDAGKPKPKRKAKPKAKPNPKPKPEPLSWKKTGKYTYECRKCKKRMHEFDKPNHEKTCWVKES